MPVPFLFSVINLRFNTSLNTIHKKHTISKIIRFFYLCYYLNFYSILTIDFHYI